jgi:DNA-binding transcriptional regulator YbjK
LVAINKDLVSRVKDSQRKRKRRLIAFRVAEEEARQFQIVAAGMGMGLSTFATALMREATRTFYKEVTNTYSPGVDQMKHLPNQKKPPKEEDDGR